MKDIESIEDKKLDKEKVEVEEKRILIDGFAYHIEKETSVENEDVQKLVKDWQNHITKYYYECTDMLLIGLGKLYVEEPNFKKNINKRYNGLAEYMSLAIEKYFKK